MKELNFDTLVFSFRPNGHILCFFLCFVATLEIRESAKGHWHRQRTLQHKENKTKKIKKKRGILTENPELH